MKQNKNRFARLNNDSRKQNNKTNNKMIVKCAVLSIVIILISILAVRVVNNYYGSSSSTADATTGKYNVKLKNLGNKKTFRTWTNAKIYDLKNLKIVKDLPIGSNIGSSTLAYKNGGFFYLSSEAKQKGKYHGVFISKVFEVRAGRKAVFAGKLVPIRNGMPLTSQKTNGGTCTAQRTWHSGLHNNIVAAVQRVQLQTGRYVPMNTAYRTYNEQLCLWDRLGHDPSKVAPPGQSNHNRGLAIDVESAFANNYEDVFRLYNLCKPMSYEPWHFEMC